MKLLLTTLFTLLLTFNINAQIITPHPEVPEFSVISFEYQKWDETKQYVSYSFIPNNIFGSPSNLDTGVLCTIARTAVLFADWNIKYKPTYKLRYVSNTIGMISYVDNEIAVIIFGTAQNAYGTPGNVSTIIYFNTKGEMLKDRNGRFIIKTL